MPDPTDACIYQCLNGVFALVGGNAPEGYTCPAQLEGTCDVEEDITLGPAVPIEEEPIPVPDPPIGGELRSLSSSSSELNSASYSYYSSSGKLYFSGGRADTGFGFFSSLTLDQLADYYPSIAKDMAVLLAVPSLASFKLTLPALPADVIARRDD